MVIKTGYKSLNNKPVKVGILMLQIIFVLAIAASINKIQTNKQHPASADAVTTPYFAVKVDGVVNYPADVATQLHRVSVTVSITNKGGSIMQISPGLQMILADNTNINHPMTADYLPPGQAIGGPLSPGQTWTGPIDFDLSSTEAPANFIYAVDSFSNPVEIKIPS